MVLGRGSDLAWGSNWASAFVWAIQSLPNAVWVIGNDAGSDRKYDGSWGDDYGSEFRWVSDRPFPPFES